MPPSSSMVKPRPPSTSTSTNPNPAPAPPKAVNPKQQALLSKIRRHLQHEPVVRGGVADPQDFKSIKEYWSSRRNKVVESFVPRGAPRRPPPAQSHMLSNSAQSFIRKLVQIQYDMDQADICLTSIGPDTFVVDEFTGTPLISCAAFKDVAPMTSPEREVDANMSSVADIVDFDIIGGDNSMPLEVSDGLLPMMRTEGYDMLYVILNHPSLVPIENRMDLNLRLYQQLFSVVQRMSKSKWEEVLRRLIFPSNWHTQVKANRFLLKIYGKTHYTRRTRSRDNRFKYVQHWTVLRFNRNSSEHGLDWAVEQLQQEFTRTELADMLYAIFPLLLHSLMRALHKVGRLYELKIQTLFVYRDAT